MSWKGEGIPQNYINALQWINVAISITPDNVDFQNTFEKLKNQSVRNIRDNSIKLQGLNDIIIVEI